MAFEKLSDAIAARNLYPSNAAMQSLYVAARSGLRKRLAEGPILPGGENDNFAQKRRENKQAVAELLEKVDFHYGFDVVLQDQNTRVFVMEDGNVLLVADQKLFYAEEDGKIKANGVCQNESWMLAKLINATTQWDIPLARARVYKNPSAQHVRVTNTNASLYEGEFPAKKVDSCIPLRNFHPDNLPEYLLGDPITYFQEERIVEGVQTEVTRGAMLFPVVAKAVTYAKDASGSEIPRFNDTFQSTIAYDTGGFYYLSSFIDDEKVILKIDQGEGSAYLTIYRKSGTNFLKEDNCSEGCRNLALLINTKFGGVLSYPTS